MKGHSMPDFRRLASREMNNPYSQAFLSLLPPGFAVMRQISMASFPDPAKAVELSRHIRAEAVEMLPELLEEFEAKAKENGAAVFWAESSQEANKYILNVCREKGAYYITKGKSMITEETGLNAFLDDRGVKVFETDLGEFITQILRRPPFHIVGPAINIPVDEINAAFLANGIISEPSNDPVALGKAVRKHLREKFAGLKVGVVGVNMAVADSGAIINVENEGNIRLTKSSPKTLIAVMSIEKVVKDMADALHIVRMLCRNCVGQKLSAYVSIDSGARRQGEIDGPEELHIVILDNLRADIYKDSFTRQALKCIRCGACLNTCPVYSKIGGYPYGHAYSGPMGQMLNPLLLGIERTEDQFNACTLCGACKDVCPAGIDHPGLFLYYRSIASSRSPSAEKALYASALAAMQSPLAFSLAIKAARLASKSKTADGYISNASAAPGWFSCRDMQAVAPRTFHELYRDIKKEKI